MNRATIALALLLLGPACVAAGDGGEAGEQACIKESPCDGSKCGYWPDLACGEFVPCTCRELEAICSDDAGPGSCALPAGCPVDFCGEHQVDLETTLTCRCSDGLRCDSSRCVHPACVGHAGVCGGVWDPLAERYEASCDDGRPTRGIPLSELQAALDAELVAAGRYVGEPTSLQSPTVVTFAGEPHLMVQSSFFWKLSALREPSVAGYSTPMLLRLDADGRPIPESRREVPGFQDGNGWARPAGFAADSPEWLVTDNRPDASYWNNELFLVLPNEDGTFTKSEALDQIVENGWDPRYPDPQVESAVLFADQRTMLVSVAEPVDGAESTLIIARRSSIDPGTTDFLRQELEEAFSDPRTTPAGLPDPSLPFNVGAFRLSADGKRLIYTREWGDPGRGHDIREIPIRSLEPLTFGTPIPYRGDRLDNDQYEVSIVTGVAETPDERWVFWGFNRDGLMRRASLTCP